MTRSMPRSWLVLPVAVLLLGACGGATAPKAAPAENDGTAALPTGECSPGQNVTATQLTPSYIIVIDVGPPQPMYTKKQAAEHSPTSGEIMLGGEMTTPHGGGMDMGGMDMGDMDMGGDKTARTPEDLKHVVVRICHRDEGEVVTDAEPEIHVTDMTVGADEVEIPVAKMQSIGAGPEDIHYGNDTPMPSGHEFGVEVHMDDEAATYQLSLP